MIKYLNVNPNSFIDVLKLQDLLTKIDEDAKDYMDQANEFSSDEKNQRIGDINKSFTKCKEYGDDKLSLAMQVIHSFC